MRKILCILLSTLFLLSLAACGSKANSAPDGNTNPPTEATENTDIPETTTPPTEVPATKTISDPENGTVLNVDLTVRGEIKANAPDIHSNQFILEEYSVEMPIPIATLKELGWAFPEAKYNALKDQLLKPERTTTFVSADLKDEDGNIIVLQRVYNSSPEEKPFDDCALSEFLLYDYNFNDTFGGITLPGGICMNSTAADVIAVFGEPENNPYFARVSVSESNISYYDHCDTDISYSFSFHNTDQKNGQIYCVHITWDY